MKTAFQLNESVDFVLNHLKRHYKHYLFVMLVVAGVFIRFYFAVSVKKFNVDVINSFTVAQWAVAGNNFYQTGVYNYSPVWAYALSLSRDVWFTGLVVVASPCETATAAGIPGAGCGTVDDVVAGQTCVVSVSGLAVAVA